MIVRTTARHLRALITSACLATGLAAAAPASAGPFQVTPVRLPLSATVKSGILTIKNQNKEPMRVQASGFAWSQAPDGAPVLTASTDLVFFPSMLSLKPGESRNIRVGSATGPGSVEKTYRVIVEELPPPRRHGDDSAVRVPVKMSIPVFIQPAAPRPEPRFQAARIDDHRLTFALANAGSSHFMTRALEVLGHDSDGKQLFSQDLPAWYVLAGSNRQYAVDLPDAACGAARIEVRARTDDKTVSLPMARPICKR
jgi:fimbrial chaperone protein